MLIQKPVDSGDIMVAKLSSGEEIVFKLVEKKENSTVIAKPLAVNIVPTQHGPQVSMMPFIITMDIDSENHITIQNTNIITMVRAAKQAKDSYIKSTSGIVPAQGIL